MGPPLKQLIKDPQVGSRVKVVFKHFPLSFHKEAKPASVASIAAHRQGKFWEFHDKCFANQKALTNANFEKWAGELGLDMAKFKADIADPAVTKIVDRDMAECRAAGVRGTPSVYLNGRKFQASGGFSPAAFKSVINKYYPKK
ncbi:MAG: protein-disulfide isomerase [Myxococcota bacterium]